MKKNVIIILMLLPILSFAQYQIEGEAEVLVANDDNSYMQPRWSPDGKMVAYTTARYVGIWTYHVENEEIRRVTDDMAAGFAFEWSSDSKAIVARMSKYEGVRRYSAIKVYDLEKDEERLITDYRTNITGLPHWAGADEKIYMYNDKQLEVFESGKKATALQKQKASSKIYFLKGDNLAIGNLSTKSVDVVEKTKNWRILNPTISPDHSKITFEVMGGHIHCINVDGTNLVDLGIGYRPQWAPDSDYLVYMITEDDGHKYVSSDLYIIKSDGSGKMQLTKTTDKKEMNPSWSPDGTWIAFDDLDEGSIYRVKVKKVENTTPVRRIEK